MSIKGRNSLANLQKSMIYNTKVDLVDDNVFKKFGLNPSIRFQDRDVMDVLVICKYEEDPIKNEGARVDTTFSPL